MQKDDIIRMARESGLSPTASRSNMLAMFAALVAAAERERIITQNAPEIENINAYIKALKESVAAEREACAKVCDFEVSRLSAIDEPRPALAVGICAAAIRARSNT